MKKLATYLFLSFARAVLAQGFDPTDQVWLAYYNTVNINEKWEVNTDLQWRSKWSKSPTQELIRGGASYKLNKLLKFYVGFAHFRLYNDDGTYRKEFRPFQEAAVAKTYHEKLKLSFRFRGEQRFIQLMHDTAVVNSYGFNWRFRFRPEAEYYLWKKDNRLLSLAVSDEYMLNYSNAFAMDQNRVYSTAKIQVLRQLAFSLQYIYVTQLVKDKLINYDVFRLIITHTINS